METSEEGASRPKYLGDYPDGAYFAAESPPGTGKAKPAGEDSHGLDIAVAGDVISMMWDYGIRVPLWDERGALPDDPQWLREVLRLSDSLIEDLTRWGDDMLGLDANPSLRTEEAYGALDLRAEALAQRLQQEVGSRYTIRYSSW